MPSDFLHHLHCILKSHQLYCPVSHRPACVISDVSTPTFFLYFPMMWHNLLTLSERVASKQPFPNVLITWAWSCPSSSSTSSFSRFILVLTPVPIFTSFTPFLGHGGKNNLAAPPTPTWAVAYSGGGGSSYCSGFSNRHWRWHIKNIFH